MRISIGLLAVALASFAAAGVACAADAGAGEQLSQTCAICHKFEKGAGNGLGPNLFGVVGRKAASLPDFAYSDALKTSHITWTADNLTNWIAGPTTMVPGTKMVFPGLTSKTDIANLIAYLSTLK